MSEEIVVFNGVKYKKVERHEFIRDDAIHCFNGGALCPISNALGETVGYTPEDFSRLRVFYNPVD